MTTHKPQQTGDHIEVGNITNAQAIAIGARRYGRLPSGSYHRRSSRAGR